MPRGGKREGAGRKKGVPDQKKMASQVTGPALGRTFEEYQRRYNVHPLDFLLGILNGEIRERKGRSFVEPSLSHKLKAAVAAAPYMHKKRTEDDPMSPLRYSMDLTKLTDEELAIFERILIKAHRPVHLIESVTAAGEPAAAGDPD
jgi:hypothetical protein